MDASDIREDSLIEVVVNAHPGAVAYLVARHGNHVICCGLPVWATLGQLAAKRGLEPAEVVDGLREHLRAA